jgi:2-dehydro-3-deoxygalactonokinase
MMRADAAPVADRAFLDGVARSGQPGHLLHHLFGVRTLGLFGELSETEAAAYLSGLLIGTEIRAALPPEAGTVHLIGSRTLCVLYAAALAACGAQARIADEDAAARGLASIGRAAGWL